MKTTTHRPRRIQIQRNSPTPDQTGDPVPNWATIASPWALDVTSVTGREYFGSQQIKAEATTIFQIRYNPQLIFLPADQVLYGTRIFDILDVIDENEQHQFVKLICKELK